MFFLTEFRPLVETAFSLTMINNRNLVRWRLKRRRKRRKRRRSPNRRAPEKMAKDPQPRPSVVRSVGKPPKPARRPPRPRKGRLQRLRAICRLYQTKRRMTTSNRRMRIIPPPHVRCCPKTVAPGKTGRS
jgi:hypothetical protein